MLTIVVFRKMLLDKNLNIKKELVGGFKNPNQEFGD